MNRYLDSIGSVLSIFPSNDINALEYGPEVDQENLAGDWTNVGQDLYTSMERIDDEQEEK